MKLPRDPKALLRAAIKELDLFAQAEGSRLEVDENGHLVASKETPLERVARLAFCYLGPLFSEQIRKEQARKLSQLKQALLNARNIVRRHSDLILELKEGDDSQHKFDPVEAINRYNRVVAQNVSSKSVKCDERTRLLADKEIKGQTIELPKAPIKSPSQGDSVQKMFKEMAGAPLSGGLRKTIGAISPTQRTQLMTDTFRIKTTRQLQIELKKYNMSMPEIAKLVKESSLSIDEGSHPELIAMHQKITVGPGHDVLVSGFFKRHSADSKFLTMPFPALENLTVTKL